MWLVTASELTAEGGTLDGTRDAHRLFIPKVKNLTGPDLDNRPTIIILTRICSKSSKC